MAVAPAITDLAQLKNRLPLSLLLAWNVDAVQSAKLDREELTVVLERSCVREACALLKREWHGELLADVTGLDWYPSEPRFEVVYHLLSMMHKERLRLKVKLSSDDPQLPSVTSIWPAANFFEREVFDLFGVRFDGHPNLRRIMMPEDWEGHPLRKDYPVEGYR